MKKNNSLTLENIGKLIDEKLDLRLTQRLAPVIKQLVQLTGETEFIRSDIGSMKADIGILKDDVTSVKDDVASVKNGLNSLGQRTASGFKMVEKRFDIVDEQLQNVLSDADEIAEQKVAKLRSDIEPRVFKLERKVFAIS